MNSFTRIQRLAWSLTALLLLMVGKVFAADLPPNIVFILSDDQAWNDYGFMGHADIKTPHLDTLASSSLFFDRGYVAAPICRPSLASLVTGLFPHQHGVTGNDVAWGPDHSGYFSIKRHELDAPLRAAFHENASFIRILTSNGYLAHQSGKWWEGSWKDGGFTHGMTHGDPKRGGRHGDDGLTIGRTSMKPVTGFIDHAVEQQKPFLLWYAPFLPHTPHNPPKRLLEKYTMPGRANDVAKYYAMIEWFDETCGELLAYLNEKDLTQNTIVISLCDNGWAASSTRPNDPHQKTFGHFALRSKASPYENGTRTPVMISWPGHVEPKKSKHLAHAIDIFPTIAAAVGLKTPEHLTGINLLDEEAVKNRKAVFGVTHSTHNMSPHNPDETLQYIWCVEDNWKLLVRYPGKDLTKWRKLHDWDKQPVRLYDVTKDPHETKEVSEAHPEVVARLKKTIEAWHAATKMPSASAGDPPFVPLFNGKDLTNFQTKDADQFWRIEDGILIGKNDPKKKGHYLWTTKTYSDFILDFDAKWKGSTKRGVDTGIELREPKLQLQLGISGSQRVDMTGSFYAGRKGYPKSGQATEAKTLLNPEAHGTATAFRQKATPSLAGSTGRRRRNTPMQHSPALRRSHCRSTAAWS